MLLLDELPEGLLEADEVEGVLLFDEELLLVFADFLVVVVTLLFVVLLFALEAVAFVSVDCSVVVPADFVVCLIEVETFSVIVDVVIESMLSALPQADNVVIINTKIKINTEYLFISISPLYQSLVIYHYV